MARGAGEILLTVGIVGLLFCVYQLFWTNVAAGAATDTAAASLRQDWDGLATDADPQQAPVSSAPAPSAEPTPAPTKPALPGDGIAFLWIPRLGVDWVKPVVEGVEKSDLHRGVGHYPGTAGPGAIGNFAVAGHRATNGEPFRDLDQVKKGDLLIVETKKTWYLYKVTSTEIVQPEDVAVIAPVPGKPGAAPTTRQITLTTCNPRWASTQRLIVHGTLQGTRPKTQGPPDALAGSTVLD